MKPDRSIGPDRVPDILARLEAQGLLRRGGGGGRRPRTLGGELESRLAGGRPLCATLVGLRNLGKVNEIFGPAAGDLLQELVREVLDAVLAEREPEALLAGVSGAQQVILHAATGSGEATSTVAAALDALTAAVVGFSSGSVRPRATAATIEVPAAAGLTSEEVLRLLHDLRARAERLQHPHLVLAAGSAQEAAIEQLRRRELGVGRVMRALEEGRVEVHYQPVVQVSDGSLYDVEALARIEEDGRLVPAHEFVDVLHDLGEIAELDAQIFRSVRRHAERLAAVTRRLFVNVSPLSLASPAFLEAMHETMEGLSAEGIDLVVVLELTEQALLEHLELIREIHQRHRVSFAVDDFGTGYSSLKTVTDLAMRRVITYLKVDGSLVRPLDDSTESYKVLLAVANLSRSLGLKVVAEHVESEAVLGRLRTLGVELAQGFLFSPALPIGDLVERWADAPHADPPAFDPRRLEVLDPYLPTALRAFYDELLSAPHFASHFTGPAQVAGLVERQRVSFLAALAEDEPALEARYVRLGELHHDIGIPFPTFMAGVEILDDQLLGVLASISNDGFLVQETRRFFRRLGELMARGYLGRILAADRRELARTGSPAGSGRAVLPCVEAIHAALGERRPDLLPDVAAERCPAHAALAAAGPDAVALHRALHDDLRSVGYFLERAKDAPLLLLYHSLRARIVELGARLAAAGAPG